MVNLAGVVDGKLKPLLLALKLVEEDSGGGLVAVLTLFDVWRKLRKGIHPFGAAASPVI